MIKILQKGEGDKILRAEAKEIPVKDIVSSPIKKIIKEMSLALRSQDDAVAIAAPQIGYSLAIFVVAGKVFSEDFLKDENEKTKDEINSTPKNKKMPPDAVFINPKITKLSKEKEWTPEGCLSVRWLYGKHLRSKKASVSAYDENGNKFVRGASGLLAQIFQHETDHLKGVLFIDDAIEVREEEPIVEKKKKKWKIEIQK